MKKWVKLILVILLLTPLTAYAADAGNATATTYALRQTVTGSELVPTQDAYLTGNTLFLDDPLRAPEDLFWIDGVLYVADTGNSRIVRLDLDTGAIETLGEEILQSPSGVFVTENEEIYVADPSLAEVLVFDRQGRVLRRYGRPESAVFGSNAQYQPAKVAVIDSGILYVVSNGSFDGVIQLDPTGEFLGYYGYNNVPMTAREILQNLIFTQAQKDRLFQKIPLAFYNLAVDDKGLCYTVTQRTTNAPLKKHNIAGVNILQDSLTAEDLADLCIGPDGQIFAVGENGLIYELDNDGVLLFSLGGQAANSERRGLFTLASGIAVDDGYGLYVLDKERGVVHTFLPTQYATLMHTAISQYRGGDYAGSAATLKAVLRLAGNMQMAYYYMGNVEMQLRDYDAALENYRRAGDVTDYSGAFWEVRNRNMSRWFGVGVLAVAALAVTAAWLNRRRTKTKEIYFYTDGKLAKERTFRQNLQFAFRFFKAPVNSFYEVKIGARGTWGTGIALYLLGFAAFALYYLGRGFTFGGGNAADISPVYLVMLYFLPVGLFVLASYMVSQVNSGEGTFRQMFIGMAYGLIPMICILPVLTILTHVLTLSESFLITVGMVAAVGWTCVLQLIALREIHNYTPGEVAVNIVLSIFLMIVMIFSASLIGMFWDTVLDTVSALLKEASYRVFG